MKTQMSSEVSRTKYLTKPSQISTHLVLFIYMISIVSCLSIRNDVHKLKQNDIYIMLRLNGYTSKWILDRSGCLGYRQEIVDNGLLLGIDLKGYSDVFVESIFGPPDERSSLDSQTKSGSRVSSISYCTSAYCDRENGIFFPERYLVFFFDKKGRVSSITHVIK